MNNARNKKSTAYENLKKKIISGLLQPGEPLSEGTLSKEFKISKTPIREALQRLERDGFVEDIQVEGVLSQESPSRTLKSSSRFANLGV